MKPMLAGNVSNMDNIKFPCYVQPKYDGIRCLIVGGEAVSRTLKPIPNKYIQSCLRGLPSYDGELLLKNPDATFQDIQSAVMSIDGEPSFDYNIFDIVNDLEFQERLELFKGAPTTLINNISELLLFEISSLEQGHEGIMIRSPSGKYKFGRSTEKEGLLLKLKRFKDAEAEVIRVEELIHQDGTAGNLLGCINVRDKVSRVQFKIGTGFTREERDYYWKNPDKIVGKNITYKYQEISQYNCPRFPVFQYIREDV